MLIVRDTATRFGLVSVVLHWYVAAAVLFLLATGFAIYYVGPHGAPRPLRADLTFFHQSVALTSIPFFLARIFWRGFTGKPKTHRQHKVLHIAAETSWRLLLILIVWQMLFGPTLEALQWFGTEIGDWELPEALAPLEDYTGAFHLFGGFAIASVLVFHIGGALKHFFIDRDRVLQNMLCPVVQDTVDAETK